MGRDKAKALKKKGARSLGSTLNERALAKLMVFEYVSQNERAIAMKKEERAEFLAIKKRDLEVHEYKERQDLMFYMQSYDHLTGVAREQMKVIRAGIKTRCDLQF